MRGYTLDAELTRAVQQVVREYLASNMPRRGPQKRPIPLGGGGAGGPGTVGFYQVTTEMPPRDDSNDQLGEGEGFLLALTSATGGAIPSWQNPTPEGEEPQLVKLYNSSLLPVEVDRIVPMLTVADVNNISLLVYGWGDVGDLPNFTDFLPSGDGHIRMCSGDVNWGAKAPISDLYWESPNIMIVQCDVASAAVVFQACV